MVAAELVLRAGAERGGDVSREAHSKPLQHRTRAGVRKIDACHDARDAGFETSSDYGDGHACRQASPPEVWMQRIDKLGLCGDLAWRQADNARARVIPERQQP